MSSPTAPAECPVCGEPVPKGARACPHCGADERSGWNEEETRYDGLDLPGGDSGNAPSANRKPNARSRALLWSVTAAAVILALLYLLLH